MVKATPPVNDLKHGILQGWWAMAIGKDSLKTRQTLTIEGKRYEYFSLPEAAKT